MKHLLTAAIVAVICGSATAALASTPEPYSAVFHKAILCDHHKIARCLAEFNGDNSKVRTRLLHHGSIFEDMGSVAYTVTCPKGKVGVRAGHPLYSARLNIDLGGSSCIVMRNIGNSDILYADRKGFVREAISPAHNNAWIVATDLTSKGSYAFLINIGVTNAHHNGHLWALMSEHLGDPVQVVDLGTGNPINSIAWHAFTP